MCEFCKEWPRRYDLRNSSVDCFVCERCGIIWFRKRTLKGDVWYNEKGEKFAIKKEVEEDSFCYHFTT